MRGVKKFITFEGIDGSGKTTVSKKVYEKLVSDGYNVVLTVEPTKTWLGDVVKRCIDEHHDPLTIAFTFIADRVEHVKQIKQWLIKEHKIVLCDRYAESTVAYQGAQLVGLIEQPMIWLESLHSSFIIEPDLTFLFVVDSDEAVRRIQDRQKLISFERKEFLSRVQDNYRELAQRDRFVIIDARKDVDVLVDECVSHILA